MIRNPCPPHHRWAALLDDSLPPAEQADLNGHLELCPACQRALEDCAAHRDAWNITARSLGQPGPTREQALRDLIDRLKTDPESEPSPDGAELPVDYLDPSEHGGSLGRIHQYEVLEEVGRGGMGVVLKALDPALHRVVAIKILAPQLAVSGTARKRFTREARAAAAIGHENVVTIHAVEEFKGLPYLVMQYVAGPSVQQRLADGGPLPVAEILRIGMQTAAGLAAAHAQGLIHRDVKPANILLENGVERVKLTDFSLARAIDDASVTQTGVVTGTPPFMAPEQARGEPLDHRADLFSLGSVMYALCTGRPPYRGRNSLDVLRRVSEDTPPPIRSLNPDIPAWLEAIVTKLMAKKPDDRYQSASEVAALLERCLAHVQQPTVVPLPGGLGAKRNRGWAVGLAAAALAIVLGATVLRIKTDKGTLEIAIDDPQAKVTVDGTDIVVSGLAGVQEFRLKAGEYAVLETKDGKPEKREIVAIKQGEKTALRVTFEGDPAVARVSQRTTPLVGVRDREFDRDRAAAQVDQARAVLEVAQAELAAAETKLARAKRLDALKQQKVAEKAAEAEVAAAQAKFEAATKLMDQAAAEAAKRDADTAAEIDRRRLAAARAGLGTNESPAEAVARERLDQLQRLATDLEHARSQQRAAEARIKVWDDGTDAKKEDLLRAREDLAATRVEAERLENVIRGLQVNLAANRRRRAASGDSAALKSYDEQLAIIANLHLPYKNVNRQAVPTRVFSAALDKVSSAVFTPDGKTLVAADWDGRIRAFDFATGQDKFVLESAKAGRTRFLAVSPDGKMLAAAGTESTINFVDLKVGKIRQSLTGKCDQYYAVAFTADGKTLAAGGTAPDGTSGLLELWDIETGKLRTVELPSPVRSLAIPPGRQDRIAVGLNKADVHMVYPSTAKSEYVMRQAGPVLSLAFSSDGACLAAIEGPSFVQLWDWQSHRKDGQIAVHGGAARLAYSPTGSVLAISPVKGPVAVVETRMNPPRTGQIDSAPIGRNETLAAAKVDGTFVAVFTPDGKSLVTVGDDNVFRVWDMSNFLAALPAAANVVGVAGLTDLPGVGNLFKTPEDPNAAAPPVIPHAPQPARTIETAAGEITSAVFLADGKELIVADQAGTVYSYEFAAGTLRFSMPDSERFNMTDSEHRRLALASNGDVFAAAGTTQRIALFNMPKGKKGKDRQMLAGRCAQYYALAFTADGKTLAAGGSGPDGHGGLLELWDLDTGKARTVEFTFLVRSLVWGRGDRLAVGTDGANVHIVDTGTGKVMYTLPQPGPIGALAATPDGHWLAAANGEGRVDIYNMTSEWRTANHRGFGNLRDNTARVTSVQFSPDGGRLVTANIDGTVKLWDRNTGKVRATIDLGESKSGPAVAVFTPDGHSVVTARDDRTIRVWDVSKLVATEATPASNPAVPGRSNRPAGGGAAPPTVPRAPEPGRTFETTTGGPIQSAAFTPDGRTLFVAGQNRTVTKYDLEDGAVGSSTTGTWGNSPIVAVSPDGKLLATVGGEGIVKFWDVQTNKQYLGDYSTGVPSIAALAFSPDGKTLAVGGQMDGRKGVVNLIDFDSSANHTAEFPAAVLSLAFDTAEQGRLAVGLDGDRVHVIDAKTGKLICKTPQAGPCAHMAISPDGKWMAVTTKNSHVHVWDWINGGVAADLVPAGGEITSVRFSPDGKWIATATVSGKAQLWDISSHQLVATIAPSAGKLYLSEFSPDGKWLATAGDDRNIRMYKVPRHADVVPKP
jgi:WD40 repeat protein